MGCASVDRPLLSFIVIAYNQEAYIRSAVQGALSQTYSPVEIILSDDASSDGTFRVMAEMAADYQGPHAIRLNHNDHNLGIGDHVNRVMAMAQGQVVVIAAGDDISVPDRTERLWRVFQQAPGEIMSVYSSFGIIDEEGRRTSLVRRPAPRKGGPVETCLRQTRVFGCSHAWHRRVFEVFGPLLPGTVYEDQTIAFRSALLGRIEYLDEPLVLYRKHAGNITSLVASEAPDEAARQHMDKRLSRRLMMYRNHLDALQHPGAPFRMDADLRQSLASHIQTRVAELELDIAFLRGTRRERLAVIRKGLSQGIAPAVLMRWAVGLVYPYDLVRVRKKMQRARKAQGNGRSADPIT